MRIGIDVSKVVPPRDGIGTYGVELVRALAAHLLAAEGDHTLRLHGLIEPFDQAAAEVALDGLPSVAQFADRSPVDDALDLFHSTTLAWPSGFEGPVVTTCFDLTFLTHPECHTAMNRLHCLEGMLEATLAESHVIAISEATAAEVKEHFATPSQRLSVIPIAAGADWAPRDTDVMRGALDALGVPGEFFLAVGTREPRKNLMRLLDAHAALEPGLRADVPLVVAGGSGWNSSELDQRLEQSESVIALGHVDRTVLGDLYSCAKAFVYPSLAEGFGLPILEAMACGAPVITSNRSSMPEVAGEAALLVDPEDTEAITNALIRIASEPGLARSLSERGAKRAQAFSWQRTAQETFEVYARVLDERR